MTEHHLKIQYDDFTAEIVLGGEWFLDELAAFILKTVGFDFDHAFEFCDNARNPYRSKERYSVFADMGEGMNDNERGVNDTPVSEVFRPRRKMAFHYDFGDDWIFVLTCTAVKKSTAKSRFKKVLSTTGKPPEQYPDFDE